MGLLILLLALSSTLAHPTITKRNIDLAPENEELTTVTPLSKNEATNYVPFSLFAQASYCPTDKIKTWTCSGACERIPEFQPTIVGGDGSEVQYYFTGFWPKEKAVVVVHEGTNPRSIVSILTDLKWTKTKLDSALFPGVDEDVEVHSGFAAAHARSARTILAETKRLLQLHNIQNVVLVGHSLGGALAALDALYLSLNLPKNIVINAVTFGMPRVGNQAFVELFDEQVPGFKRVNHQQDIVPLLPPRILGFMHSRGEIHVWANGSSVACPGDDNDEDDRCISRSVGSVFNARLKDHSGSYPGDVRMGRAYCGNAPPSWGMGSAVHEALSFVRRFLGSELMNAVTDRFVGVPAKLSRSFILDS